MADANSISDEYLDAIYQQVMDCEPAIQPQEVERLADLVFSRESVIRNWRLTAFIAGKGGEFYRELSNNEGKARAFVPAMEALRDFATLLRGMADLAESAVARISVAGCNHEHFFECSREVSHD